MRGLILLAIVYLVVYLVILRRRKIKWSSVIFKIIAFTVVFCLVFALIELFILQNFLPKEWQELNQTQLGNSEKIFTANVRPNIRSKEVFIFSPIMGHEVVMTEVDKTNICSYGGNPFLVKYKLNLAPRYKSWFVSDNSIIKWQVYLPSGTLVAGERI